MTEQCCRSSQKDKTPVKKVNFLPEPFESSLTRNCHSLELNSKDLRFRDKIVLHRK